PGLELFASWAAGVWVVIAHSSQVVHTGGGAELFLEAEGSWVGRKFGHHRVGVVEIPKVAGVPDAGFAACRLFPTLEAVGAEGAFANRSNGRVEVAPAGALVHSPFRGGDLVCTL